MNYREFLNEEIYTTINNLKLDDVIQNFENNYGKDNTTELTTFKDMSQKDGYPGKVKERANLFLAIKNRDEKNPKVKKSFYKSNDYLDESEEKISDLSKPNPNALQNKKDKVIKNHYVKMAEEAAFIQGYLDALNETTKK